MRKMNWLIATGLLVSTTACVETNGYPGTSYPTGYGGYPSSGYNQPAYSGYGQPNAGGGFLGGLFGGGQPNYQPAPAYYQQAPAYYPQQQTRYVPVPVASPQAQYAPRSRSSWGSRDRDGDGIPNRYDRDRNNDGIPDRQRREPNG